MWEEGGVFYKPPGDSADLIPNGASLLFIVPMPDGRGFFPLREQDQKNIEPH